MASVFPASLDNIATDKVNGTIALNDHPAHHDLMASAINAVESYLLGTGPGTMVLGTANQITATPGVGAVTLSLPSGGTLPGAWHAATGFTLDAGAFVSTQTGAIATDIAALTYNGTGTALRIVSGSGSGSTPSGTQRNPVALRLIAYGPNTPLVAVDDYDTGSAATQSTITLNYYSPIGARNVITIQNPGVGGYAVGEWTSSGMIRWGSGVYFADTNLRRSAAGALIQEAWNGGFIDTSFAYFQGQGLTDNLTGPKVQARYFQHQWNDSATGNTMMSSQIAGRTGGAVLEANFRWRMLVTGEQSWGAGGDVAPDVRLFRGGGGGLVLLGAAAAGRSVPATGTGTATGNAAGQGSPLLTLTAGGYSAFVRNTPTLVLSAVTQTQTGSIAGAVNVMEINQYTITAASGQNLGGVNMLSIASPSMAGSAGTGGTAPAINLITLGSANNQASAAAMTYTGLRVAAHTVTLTGSTLLTATPAIAAVYLDQITVANVTTPIASLAATLYIKGAPIQGTAGNLTAVYAAWFDSGVFRWDDNIAAPSTSIGVGIVNFYGSSATNFLGDPNLWLRVNVGGTDYKLPLYS